MKSNNLSRFSVVITLKSLGGELFSPGALSFVSSVVSIVNSVHSSGISSSVSASCNWISLMTLSSVGFMSFINIPEWIENTFSFSSSVVASYPDVSLFWIVRGEAWWLFSPLINRRIFTQASLGWKDMLWITSARCLDQRIFAIAITSYTSHYRFLSLERVWTEGASLLALISYNTLFLTSKLGVSVSCLWWYHNWYLLPTFVSVSYALLKMASLYSV